jgi:hypothetical protein
MVKSFFNYVKEYPLFFKTMCFMTFYLSNVVKAKIPEVPHKAVAEVSKIGNLYERLAVVNQGWQSESTDGPKGA